jgi:preprotein translocase subunit YajC
MDPNAIIMLAVTGAPALAQGFDYSFLLMMGMIFVIFYLFLIRPQAKKQKQHQEMISSLERGAEVVTTGGIYGKITGLTDSVITVEVAPNVRIKVSRGSVSGLAKDEAPAPEKK